MSNWPYPITAGILPLTVEVQTNGRPNAPTREGMNSPMLSVISRNTLEKPPADTGIDHRVARDESCRPANVPTWKDSSTRVS